MGPLTAAEREAVHIMRALALEHIDMQIQHWETEAAITLPQYPEGRQLDEDEAARWREIRAAVERLADGVGGLA